MSYFISFVLLIVPVYASCLCLDAVLLSTRHSNRDPLLTLTRSRMTTGGGGGGGGPQGPGESLILRPTGWPEVSYCLSMLTRCI